MKNLFAQSVIACGLSATAVFLATGDPIAALAAALFALMFISMELLEEMFERLVKLEEKAEKPPQKVESP